MDTRIFDTLMRNAAAVSRRTSLAALGGAALAATGSVAGEAKKKNRKKKKKCPVPETCPTCDDCESLEQTACETNEEDCVATGTLLCAGEPTCLASIQLCCRECHSNDFLICLVAVSA